MLAHRAVSRQPGLETGSRTPLNESRRSAVHVYRFDTTRKMEWKGLRFPFASTWRAERGHHVLTRRLGEKPLRPDIPTRIWPEELIDVCAIPDQTGAATGWLELDIDASVTATEPDWNALRQAFKASGGFGLALAQAMFRLPQYTWRIEEVAHELGVTRRSLQMTLFRESYSFDAALRRCRRLHEWLSFGDPRCRFAGFPSSAAFAPPTLQDACGQG